MLYIKLLPSFIKWLLLLPIHLGMIFVTYLLSPFIALFGKTVKQHDGWVEDTLPSWLNWFLTPRDPLSGNKGFQQANSHLPRYLVRVKWLIRNPSYGFAHDYLGTKLEDGTKLLYKGDIKTHDQYKGWLFMWTEDYKYFGLKVYLPTLNGFDWSFKLFGKTIPLKLSDRALKFRIGWKLHDWTKVGYSFGHQRKYLFTLHPLKEREFYED